MNAPVRAPQTRTLELSRQEIAEIVVRYPDVSNAEARLIVDFLRKGRHLDVGILTADEALKPQLDSFMADHKKELGVGLGEGTAVVGAIGAFLGLCWLLWEVGRPGIE